MPPVPPRRRWARPVADAPIDPLLARSEDLAKGWLLALLERAPLDNAPAILNPALTRDGPRVCSAVLRALADDADLHRLEPDGALRALAARTGELAGASGAGAVSEAIDALQGVVWSALRAELADPDPELVSQLAERLTLVCERVRTAALERAPAAQAPAPPPDRGLTAVPPTGPVQQPDDAADSDRAPEALWVGALQDEIRRAPGTPLSLLLAEVEDAERLVVSGPQERTSAAFGQFGQAVRSVVRREDILVRETDARAWLIARGTGRRGAHALGARIADSVGETAAWGETPLVASIGVAVLGEDGRTATELIEAAEEARFAASASGIEVSRRERDARPSPGADDELSP